MTWKPHVTVAAVVEKKGRFLCVEETIDGHSKLNQPAGHLEPGENLIDAIQREMLEETRFEFVPEHIVGIYLWRKDAASPTFLRVTFCGTLGKENSAAELDPDIDAITWLTHKEISERSREWRSSLVGRSVVDYLAGNRFPLTALIDLLPQ